MKTIHEAARAVPVIAETDVLVIGSGPAGLAAALAAARCGVETMIVERYGSFGGNITQSQVETIAWYRTEGTVESDGIGMEFERRHREMGIPNREYYSLGEMLDADMFKYIADVMVQEAGITSLLHCYAVEAVMEGSAVTGVITESKTGRRAILARQVIDATGDADIAHFCGAPYRLDPKDQLMSVTMSFGCSGVNKKRFYEYVEAHPKYITDWARETSGKESGIRTPYLSDPFEIAKSEGKIPKDIWVEAFWHSVNDYGEATHINACRVKGIDSTDVHDLTRAEMEGRQHCMWILDALKKSTPGFENAKLRSFGSSVGARESRKIIGAYQLTERDILEQKSFEDSIGIFPEFLDAYGKVYIPTTGRYFQLPYRIMLPQGVENLLVAGRSVAGDKLSHAATRQMMCCTVTGQGAGTAAATAVKSGSTAREVDIPAVQRELQRQGVRLS